MTFSSEKFPPTYVETPSLYKPLPSLCLFPSSRLLPIRHFKVSKAQYDYLRTLALSTGLYIQRKSKLSPSGNLKGFVHLLGSYINRFKMIQRNYDGWLP